MPDLVTLVDRDDNVVGAEEKIRAHREGKLHRAFSVFVFDEGRRLLIQRRATQVFIGWFNGLPSPDTREVEACRWMDLAELRDSIEASPERYTPWLRLLLKNRDWPAMDENLGGRKSPQ